MPTPQSPFAVARALIEKAEAQGVSDLTPMKLMKLAYIAHGWALCFTDGPLLAEPIEAWAYGPVVPSIYHQFKRFGASPIPFSEKDLLPAFTDDATLRAIIDGVMKGYKHLSGVQLSAMTHRKDSPWYHTWHECGGAHSKNLPIDNDLIRRYFEQQLDKTAPESLSLGA